jgi:mannose-1-phosphate guanylyltransferase
MPLISKAFVLGAGLGTRLRPLTEGLPKPLVPVWNRPLAAYAFDHLVAELGVEALAVNTHHCPEAYSAAFPGGGYRGRPLLFRHEPLLLDTAGGIDNLRDWLPRDGPFVVYNGDILADFPLGQAVQRHLADDNLVTLLLRSQGEERRVGFDPDTGRIVDLRGVLAPDWAMRFQFAGVYVVSPDFLGFLEPGKVESVVLPMLEAIRRGGRVGGFVSDEGAWSDLGERGAYLDALSLPGSGFPRYGDPREILGSRLAEGARIAPSARIDGLSTVGEGAEVGEGASLSESVVWPGAFVAPGASLRRVVVRSGKRAEGELNEVDV